MSNHLSELQLLLIEELTEQSSEDNFNNQENKNETIFDEDLNKYYLSGSKKSLTNSSPPKPLNTSENIDAPMRMMNTMELIFVVS